MSYQTLLVQVEGEPNPDPGLVLAVDLANQFNAKLIGVGVYLHTNIHYGGFSPEWPALGAVEAEKAYLETDIRRAEEKFRGAATAVKHGFDWRTALEVTPEDIAAEARAADLVVTNLFNRRVFGMVSPGALILLAGRPVLVAPPNATRLEAKSVVVAWKDTREARRAVSDAMPLLQRAKSVALVEICNHKDESSAASARLDDVANYLLRHDVKAAIGVGVADGTASAIELFLATARGQKADLIVAGGYGRGRVQEWVFGGFTQALTEQTEYAVLFSH